MKDFQEKKKINLKGLLPLYKILLAKKAEDQINKETRDREKLFQERLAACAPNSIDQQIISMRCLQ